MKPHLQHKRVTNDKMSTASGIPCRQDHTKQERNIPNQRNRTQHQPATSSTPWGQGADDSPCREKLRSITVIWFLLCSRALWPADSGNICASYSGVRNKTRSGVRQVLPRWGHGYKVINQGTSVKEDKVRRSRFKRDGRERKNHKLKEKKKVNASKVTIPNKRGNGQSFRTRDPTERGWPIFKTGQTPLTAKK